jgi:hypothetical protein
VSAIIKTDITSSALTLISDKTTTTKTSFSDNSGILTRTIIDAGEIKEEAVASTINAKEIILNGNSLLAEKLEKDQLLKTISSEYNLNDEQIIQVKAILNSREWYDKTTTMSQLGSIMHDKDKSDCVFLCHYDHFLRLGIFRSDLLQGEDLPYQSVVWLGCKIEASRNLLEV